MSRFFLFFLALLLCVFFQTSSYSQEKYLPGYVVSLSQDTTHGFIDYRDWGKNSKLISFKVGLNEPRIRYTPIDIKGFAVGDETYIGEIVEVEDSPHEHYKLSTNKDLNIKIDTVFLQSLIIGLKSLYYYRTSEGKDQFYIYENAVYKLLVYKSYLRYVGDRSVVAENKKYLGQLASYMGDCSELNTKISTVKYTRGSLEKLFKFYHHCVDSDIEYETVPEKFSIEAGVLAGVSFTSFNFQNRKYDFYHLSSGAEFLPSTDFTGGVFFDVVFPRNQGRWVFHNELLYSSYNVEGVYRDITSENLYAIHYMNFAYTHLKLNSMVRFRYPVSKKIIVFLNAGLSYSFGLNETNERLIESKAFSVESTDRDKALYRTKKNEQGVAVGVGTFFKDFIFEARFEAGNGMSNQANVRSSSERLILLLGYRF